MWVTLALTLAIFITVLLVLFWVRTPRYRLERHNVIDLLELVLTGQATENDWRVFMAVPLRHDLELDAIRQDCMDIEEHEPLGPRRPGFLFSQQGLIALQDILCKLKQLQSSGAISNSNDK